MLCNKCNTQVDERLIKHFDTLPPMMGYNFVPECARCVACREPVCRKCLFGLGLFTFVCKSCKPAYEDYLEDRTKPHPLKEHIQKLLNEGLTQEQIAERLALKKLQ